ncbi:hypothetical protein M0802_000181 [Mischocyttarus mexicanus]|nr:hypothetical protein M0802_000181 [Mischocyttarus mexicanus]
MGHRKNICKLVEHVTKQYVRKIRPSRGQPTTTTTITITTTTTINQDHHRELGSSLVSYARRISENSQFSLAYS